jgi:hypothetical protein
MLRKMVALEGGDAKRMYSKLIMRWHPDKFQHRWVGGLSVVKGATVFSRLNRAGLGCRAQVRERAGGSGPRAHPRAGGGDFAASQPSVGREGLLVLFV